MRNPHAAVSAPDDFVTAPGDKYHVTYAPRVLDDGTIKLVESGKDDIQQSINSYRPSTDMSFILQRMSVGDMSVLNSGTPSFGDFTEMPKTYAEALQLVIDGEREFKALPLDVRNKFDNDFRRYLASAGSDDWLSKMADVMPKPDNVDVVEPVPSVDVVPTAKE